MPTKKIAIAIRVHNDNRSEYHSASNAQPRCSDGNALRAPPSNRGWRGNCRSCWVDGGERVALAAVSYTHLDVYKRQPILRNWPAPPWTVTVVSLAFFPIFFALLQGQDAILLLFLYGLAFVSWKQKRLVSAGAWLACGMFKFHLVLPFLLLILIQEKTAQARKRIEMCIRDSP